MPRPVELDKLVQSFVRRGLDDAEARPHRTGPHDPVWAAVRATGTHLWLDTGDIDEAGRLWNDQFEALTTNNTLLNKQVQTGVYDQLVTLAAGALRDAGVTDPRKLLLEIAFILNAHHALRLVRQFDAYVSVELHTDLADDVEASLLYGVRYQAISPTRFYVKLPFTPAGLIAARRLTDLGITVNLTLGFSARQNYLAALLARPAFVNVFLGRLNSFVRDNALGDGRNVGEKTTLATQRQVTDLRCQGRARSLLIAASMRDPSQVPALAGVDVFTMPANVAAGYRDNPASTIGSRIKDDPPVKLSAKVHLADFAGQTLWDVPDAFKQSVDRLLQRDINTLTPPRLVDHFATDGFADLFPRWTEPQIRTAAHDGKIPVFAKWKDELAGGRIGLDALMNLCAMQSFATDQKALDDRVRGLIGL